jgi:hypothetical protein
MFAMKHRTRTMRPTPVVALAVDVSGSMKAMTASMGTLSWVISNAFHRIGGDFAAVTFGDRVASMVAPRNTLSEVPLFSANAGHEEINTALLALEGALPLGDPSRVRLVVLCSDNIWVSSQQRGAAVRRIEALRRSGVEVISIHNQGQSAQPGVINLRVPDAASDPVAAARLIGDLIVSRLTAGAAA